MASIAFSVSGVSATVAVGSEVAPANFGYGWGSPPWGGAPPADPTIGWGAYPPAVVTSLQAIGSIGTVTVTGTALVIETGLRGLTRLGNETVLTTQSTSFSVAGVEAIVDVSDVSVANSIAFLVSGVSSASGIGTVNTKASALIVPTTVQAISTLNQVVFKSTSVVTVSGVTASLSAADLVVSAFATVSAQQVTGNTRTNAAAALAGAVTGVTEVVITTTLSSVTISGTAVTLPSSISGVTNLGQVIAQAGAIPTITSVSATGQVGSLAAVTGIAVVTPSGVEGVCDVKTVSVLAGSGVSIAVTATEAVSSLGSVSVVGASNHTLFGVGASLNLGEESVSAAAMAPVSGFGIASGLGSVQIVAGAVATVAPGLYITPSIGDVSFSLGSVLGVSGLRADLTTGNVFVTAPLSTGVQGFQLTSSLGDETTYVSVLQRVFNTVATAILGTSVAKADSYSLINGLSLSGIVADVISFVGKANVFPVGASAAASVNNVGVIAGTGVSISTGSFVLQTSIGSATVSSITAFPVNGVFATTSSGDELVRGDAIVIVGAGGSAFQSYLLAFQGLNSAFQQGTGVSGLTGYIGSVAVLNTVDYVPVGLELVSGVGSVIVRNSIVAVLSGVSTQSFIGTVFVYSSTAFRADTVSAFVSLGSPTVTGTSAITASGVVGNTILANVSVNPAMVSSVSGVSATVTVDSDSVVTGKALVYPSSVSATAELNSVSIVIQDTVFISVAGVEAVAYLGTTFVSGRAINSISGLSATANAGTVTVFAASTAALQGLGAIAGLGAVSALIGNTVRILGGVESSIYLSEVEVTSAQPIVIVSGVSGIFGLSDVTYANTISGVGCVGYIGELQIWTNVNDEQECNWSSIPKGACNPWLPVTTPCGPQTLSVSGVEGEGYVGDAVVLSGIIFSVFGVQAEFFLGDITTQTSTVVIISDPLGDLEAVGEVGFVTIDIVEPQFVVVQPRSIRIRALLGNETVITTSSTTVRVSGEEADVTLGDVTVSAGQVISIQAGVQARARLSGVSVLAYGGWGIPRWGGDSDPPTGWGDQGLAA